MIEEITFCMKGHRTTVCRVTGGRENELGIRARFDYRRVVVPVTVTVTFCFRLASLRPPAFWSRWWRSAPRRPLLVPKTKLK
jgi:hypothetical protein